MAATTAHSSPQHPVQPPFPPLSAVAGPATGAATAGPRLALRAPGAPTGLLDGAWWPRSRDLARELPELVEALDARWGRITRIAVNARNWPSVPHKIPVTGHVVKAGWFTTELDPHKLLLLSYGTGRWDLLVVPPRTDPDTAARLMAAASGTGGGPPLTASALIAAEAGEQAGEETGPEAGEDAGSRESADMP